MTPSRLFRTVAIAEAVTWGLLIAGMLQKYVFQAGEWGVSIGGGIHGFVFLAYVVITVLVAVNQRWSAGVSLLALAAAIIPFATVPVEIAYGRAGRLDGGWRTQATDDPRDRRPLDRLVRWWVARPWLLVGIVAVGVVIAFVTLLIVGPPFSKSA